MTTLKLIVGAIVSLVWGATFYAAIQNPALVGLATVATPVMSLVVGGLFAGTAIDLVRGKRADDA